VPRDVVEAAILDDTPLWKIIVRIKLPLVRPAIVMLVFLKHDRRASSWFTEPQILESFQQGSISVNYNALLLHLEHGPSPATRPTSPPRWR